jgi:hypothetical protein
VSEVEDENEEDDMAEPYPYTTHLNIYYDQLELVDVPALVAACNDQWYNQTLCRVNESVVRLGVMRGEYHWHKHDNDDEFFFVLEGHCSSIWRNALSISGPGRASSCPRGWFTAPGRPSGP